MGRLLKYVLIAAGAIVGLLVLLVLAVAVLFDPNDYKDEIAARVEAATGRSFSLEGDLELGLFPWLSVDTGRIVVGNAEGFGPEPFAELESASVSIRLWPLLRRKVEAGRIGVDGLKLNLAVAASGRNNWEDLAAEDDTAAPAEDAGPGVSELRAAGFSLSDATIDYRDAAAGSRYRLSAVNLDSGAIQPGEPFDVDAGFKLETLPEGPGGEFRLKTTATVDLAESRVALRGLDFSGDLADGETPLAVGLAADSLLLDTAAETLELKDAVARLASLRAETSLSGSVGDKVSLAGRLEVPRFSPKELTAQLGSPLPPTNDAGVFERASFSGDVKIGSDSFAISALKAVLDDTTLGGQFSVSNFDRPAYRFSLTGDRIDLDRYMAPAAEDAPAENDTAALDATEIPVELLRSLDAKGELKFNEVVLGGLTLRNIQLGVNGQGGVLRLHPISAQVFEGAYRGDVRIDASGSQPRLSLDENVEGVQLAAFGREMLETQKISGGLDGRFRLAGRGANLAEIRRDLGGDVRFELTDGAFEGTDLWYQIRRARALFKKEAPPPAPSSPRTPFSTVRGTGTVAGGVLTNNDLFAELPFLRATGAGTIDLAEATLDYGVRATVFEKPELLQGATEAELAEYTEAVIPIRITGALADPSIRPDVEGMLREKVKGRVEEEKERLQRRLLDKLGIGGKEEAPAEGAEAAPGEQPAEEKPAEEKPAEEEKSVEDEVKDRLKKLLGGDG